MTTSKVWGRTNRTRAFTQSVGEENRASIHAVYPRWLKTGQDVRHHETNPPLDRRAERGESLSTHRRCSGVV